MSNVTLDPLSPVHSLRTLRLLADAGHDYAKVCDLIRRTLAGLSRPECIAVARDLGIVRRVRTRSDAVLVITQWVLAVPLARQSIAY